MFPGQCGNTAFFFKSQPDQFHFEFRGIVFPGKSFFSAHEVSTCKISGCLSYRILDSGPDGTQTTLTIILRLRGKDSVSVNQALTDKFLSLPSELRKSLTWDRGMELARHLEFTVSTGVKVYFCDPQSPWQRGTNENTNGLIRQYFPKKTCLAQYTQHELDLVAAQLNNRPRKTLKFKTPKEIIERGVALTD